jgi:hypothetical protein
LLFTCNVKWSIAPRRLEEDQPMAKKKTKKKATKKKATKKKAAKKKSRK